MSAKPLDEITDKLGDDFGEDDAEAEMETYVTKKLAEIDTQLKA
jgi:hypothetical protein